VNPYQVLGVSAGASKVEIGRAFRTKSKDLHPDANPNNEQEFKALVDAHQILTNDKKKARYDRGEDPNSLSSEARGLEVAIQTFQEVLKQTLGNIEKTELIILSIIAVSEQKIKTQQELKKAKKIVQKLRVTKKRLTLKDKTQIDYLGNAIEGDLQIGTETIGLLKDKVEACDKAMEIFNNYDFEADTEIGSVHIASIFTSSTTS